MRRQGRPRALRQDHPNSCCQVGGRVVGCSDRRQLPLGLMAHIEQDGPAAGPPAGFDVMQDVPDQPGSREIDPIVARRLLEHPFMNKQDECMKVVLTP
jgi:hypothetical protein